PGQPAQPAGQPAQPAEQPAQPAEQPAEPAQPAAQPQPPAVPGVVPPVPGVDPDPQDPAPVRAQRPLPDPNTPGAALNAANLTGQDVADLYFQYTGKRVLVSQEASSGEISFIVPGQMTYGEAATIIEKKLVMEGFELVPDDDDPYLVKMVLANSPQGVKQQGAPVVSDLSALDGPADRFVTYVMALEYLKPDEALRAFQTVVQQFGSAGTVAAVPNAGSVVISGNTPLVRMLVELKER
ncbi:MAG: hypothetical protein GWO24_01630, partial [Akkermansiaceae bacterium]|nr:hypothetical protein [Akkermansiaceae bacterium]